MPPVYTVSDLCDAASAGNVTRLREILDTHPELVDVRLAENNEHRALHFAVLNRHTEAARVLVEAGANLGSGIYPHRDATGPLVMAEDRGYDDLVQVLRDEDEKRKLAACSNIKISPENDELFEAVKEGRDQDAFGILDEHPDLLNACHRNGGSVVYAAACHGRHRLLQELLRRGADIEHLTPDGASPLDGAAHNIRGRNRPLNEGCLLAAGMLLQAGSTMSAETAVALGDFDALRLMADRKPERFRNDGVRKLGLLSTAVTFDSIEMVRLLLDLGLDPDDRHQHLEYETKPYSWGGPLWLASGESQYDIAEVLLEAGADPNSSIYASGNPIGRAYNNRDERMKGLLFRYGAVLDETTAALNCDTSACAVYLEKQPELAGTILRWAACAGDPDTVGMSIRKLDWSMDDSRWFSILEQPLRIWQCAPHRKFRDFDRSKFPEVFRLLLNHGVSPNLVGRFGYRLAHHLVACGVTWNEPIMTEAERLRFGEILCDHGTDLNVTDDLLHSTPLGWAARWGKTDLVRLYLDRGADPTLAGEPWATPLAWAEKRGHEEIANLIRQHT